jgi:hypothetical protein
MIIECPNCDSKVDAKVLASKQDDVPPDETYFLCCPVCDGVLLAFAEFVRTGEDDWELGPPKRLWPPATFEESDRTLPKVVRKSLVEAEKCYKAKAFGASAVMCGRAIEALCHEHKTKAKNLAGGLKELKQRGIIDGRLFDWGDALRERRNIGAHASEEDITQQDAKDVLEFAKAICEYVFVLSDRYEAFVARSKKNKPIPPEATA